MDAISLDAVIAMTGRSKRTWWRRVSEGAVTRLDNDRRGRAMVLLDEILPQIKTPLDDEARELLLLADAGGAEAQNDVAQFFALAGQIEIALYWWRAAALQEYSDAMQHLGFCYLRGEGVEKDEDLGLMWVAKAAASGHQIARMQMQALRDLRRRPEPCVDYCEEEALQALCS